MFSRNMKKWIFAVLIVVVAIPTTNFAGQWNITRVEQMPNQPSPLNLRDWYTLARNYDTFSFNASQSGQYLPLLWWDNSHVNVSWTCFGLPTYVGHYSQYQQRGNSHEAIACMGSVLSGSLVGINKTSQSGADFVRMCADYFNSANGENAFLNYTSTSSGNSFWYEILPGILAGALVSQYPSETEMANGFYSTADRWYNAAYYMRPNFDHTAFNLKTSTPVNNGSWTEPDCAAGIAYLELMAYKKWSASQHYNGARWSLDYLQGRSSNPNYECMMPFGALAAARMNAEYGTSYDVAKFINWCFDDSSVRSGWGAITARWGSEDCYGLIGSRTDGGGYAFTMNTQIYSMPLVPLARYDNRFARAIGKWMLNASNACRLMYPNYISSTYQDDWNWSNSNCSTHCLPYEGLRATKYSKSPYATGDAKDGGWAPTNLSNYAGGMCGAFGGIIRPTNVSNILSLDCLVTDFHRPAAWSTYLYYNPNSSASWVNITVSGWNYSLWDGCSNTWVRQNIPAGSQTNFSVPANGASVIVAVKASAAITYSGNKMLADGVVVDYNRYD